MDRMHLVAVDNDELAFPQMIMRCVKNKIKFSFLHCKNLNGPVPVFLPDIFSAVSLE